MIIFIRRNIMIFRLVLLTSCLILGGALEPLNDIASHADVCPDQELGNKCKTKCEMDYVDCTLQCSSTNCLVDCGRVLNECDTSCPCELGCPNGCVDCANPICVCGDHITPANEENLESCVRQNSIDLGQCIIDCNENEDCEAACISNFKNQQINCPCQDKCPYGCPCDDFECEPDKNSILVLNTQSSNKPVLINYDGGVQNDLEFAMGPETSVYFSCSAKLNGDFYVFGGFGSDNRQISKINGCSLKRIGQLPQQFELGSCGTYNFPDERVMFCFPTSQKKKCFSFNGINYTDHPNTINEHFRSQLGNIDNKVFVVGGGYASTSNKQTEIFDIGTNKWQTKSSFPYCSAYIYFYGVVSRKDSVLIMGGLCDGVEVSQIAKFSATEKWSKEGNLQAIRSAHRAISNGDRVYVVGGSETSPTEIWSKAADIDDIDIKVTEPRLSYYRYYPELFIVDSKFCTNK